MLYLPVFAFSFFFSFSPASIQLPSLPPSNNGKENQILLLIWLSYFWVNCHFLRFLRQGRHPIVLSLLNAGMCLLPYFMKAFGPVQMKGTVLPQESLHALKNLNFSSHLFPDQALELLLWVDVLINWWFIQSDIGGWLGRTLFPLFSSSACQMSIRSLACFVRANGFEMHQTQGEHNIVPFIHDLFVSIDAKERKS